MTAHPGSVVLVEAPHDREHLVSVIVAETADAVTVAPIDSDVDGLSDADVLLDESTLGYAAFVACWNYGQVLPEQIKEVITELGERELEAVAACVRVAGGASSPSACSYSGAAILSDEDPRAIHQHDQARCARVFWEPALALAGSLTVGQLVRHRRDEFYIDERALDVGIQEPGWLDALERDMLDIRSTLTTEQLAELLGRLGIRASRRLARIIASTIEIRAAQSDQAQDFARARHAKPREAAAAGSTVDYVNRVLERLPAF